MQDEVIESEGSSKKKNESADLSLSTRHEKSIKKKEKPKLIENDTAAVNEAAQKAEKAVSDAVKGVAQIIESMKS